jgi:predicted exporter
MRPSGVYIRVRKGLHISSVLLSLPASSCNYSVNLFVELHESGHFQEPVLGAVLSFMFLSIGLFGCCCVFVCLLLVRVANYQQQGNQA